MNNSKTPYGKDIHTYSNRLTCLIRLYVNGFLPSDYFLQQKDKIFNEIVQDRKSGIYENAT